MGAFTPLPSDAAVVTGEVVVNVAPPVLYKKAIDKVSSVLMYVGEAVPGTASATAAWRIKRITPTGVEFAGTAVFDQVWNNRASLSYI